MTTSRWLVCFDKRGTCAAVKCEVHSNSKPMGRCSLPARNSYALWRDAVFAVFRPPIGPRVRAVAVAAGRPAVRLRRTEAGFQAEPEPTVSPRGRPHDISIVPGVVKVPGDVGVVSIGRGHVAQTGGADGDGREMGQGPARTLACGTRRTQSGTERAGGGFINLFPSKHSPLFYYPFIVIIIIK
jgi:hypothetical protein